MAEGQPGHIQREWIAACVRRTMGEGGQVSLSPLLRMAALAARITPAPLRASLYRLGPISRFVRALLTRSAPAGPTEVTVAGGAMSGARLLLDLQMEKDLWLGSYEPGMLAAIEAYGRPGMIAYDVGAHIGYITIALARIAGESGRVMAFEPHSDNLSRMRSNLALNGLGRIVQIEAAAVGEGTREDSFLVHNSAGMGKLTGSHGRDADYSGSHIVQVVALDDYVFGSGNPPPDLVKIDVEGGEAAVLRGMQRVLRESKPVLLLEIHGPEAAAGCWEQLSDAGYRVQRLAPGYPQVRSPEKLGWKAYVLAGPEGGLH